MFIAQQLKDKNIAEYLIYMWQVEDLIRANDCDINKIKENIISQYQIGGEEKKRLIEWYENLITMMNEEGVKEKGHLQINNNVVLWLNELHLGLLRNPKFPFYGTAYFKALPFIVELRSKSGKKDETEVETCFEALYGLMLLRLQKKEISADTQKAVKEISNFISLLANYYDKDRKGELKLDD